MTKIPTDGNTLLSRKDLAAALTASGFPITTSTLETLATRGGGPVFRKFGSRVIYTWADAIAWAEGRLSKRVSSTSELHAAA